MCSWPPEDDRIESFHRHVRDQARAILGSDLARVEKFTTSVRDGIDIRRPCETGTRETSSSGCFRPAGARSRRLSFSLIAGGSPDLYPSCDVVRGALGGVDPGLLRDRSNEKHGGPGHRPGRVWRGAVPLPAPAIPKNWTDPRLQFADTLEERLLAAAFLHSEDRHVAVVSPGLALGLDGGGWLAGTAARSSTCHSRGSAAR